MFTVKLVLAALSVATFAAAIPAGMSPREDWKTAVGWDGKVSTPADLDPSNVSNPTPGVSTLSDADGIFRPFDYMTLQRRAAGDPLNGGLYMCTDANWGGSCVSAASTHR
jgi:hypothetical protein